MIPANNIDMTWFRQHRNQPGWVAPAQFSFADEMYLLAGTRDLSQFRSNIIQYAGIWKFNPTYGYTDICNTYTASASGGSFSLVNQGGKFDGYRVNLPQNSYITYAKLAYPNDFGSAYAGDFTLILLDYSHNAANNSTPGRLMTAFAGGSGDTFIRATYSSSIGVYLNIMINNRWLLSSSAAGTAVGDSLIISRRGGSTAVWRNGSRLALSTTNFGVVAFNAFTLGQSSGESPSTAYINEIRIHKASLYDPNAATITPPTATWG